VTSSYRGLGFDPTPGDVGAVGALADALRAAGGHATEAGQSASAAQQHAGDWTGPAADAYRQAAGDAPDRLAAHATATGQAADLLYDWAGTLSDNRLQAESLDRRARALDEQISTAEANVEQWSIALSVASTHSQAEARAKLLEHERTLRQLQDRRSDVLTAAHDLAADHQRAARSVAGSLAALATGGPTPAAAPARSSAARDAGTALGALSTITRRANRIAGLVRPGTVAAAPRSGLGSAAAALAAPVGSSGTWEFAERGTSPAALELVARAG
jgi:hypothetical protein